MLKPKDMLLQIMQLISFQILENAGESKQCFILIFIYRMACRIEKMQICQLVTSCAFPASILYGTDLLYYGVRTLLLVSMLKKFTKYFYPVPEVLDFPQNYELFLVFRCLVGVGEASYSTIAPTIISDLFVKDMRSKMLAVFYFAIPVGR